MEIDGQGGCQEPFFFSLGLADKTPGFVSPSLSDVKKKKN